ncbi:hypothetical protein TNCV_1057361 [Trichonephila clavipes]|nr:hypothetical protein TNCV_1057361 [Trichonephila clavipes]
MWGDVYVANPVLSREELINVPPLVGVWGKPISEAAISVIALFPIMAENVSSVIVCFQLWYTSRPHIIAWAVKSRFSCLDCVGVSEICCFLSLSVLGFNEGGHAKLSWWSTDRSRTTYCPPPWL